MRTVALFVPAVAPGFPGSAAAQADRVDALPVVRTLASSRTTSADLVSLPGGAAAVRKRWRWPRPADRAKGVFRTTVGAASPARREFEALLRLADLPPPGGPFAPRPLALTERRSAGVLSECALLLDFVPGTVDFGTFLATERDPAVRTRALRDLGLRTAAMHAAGLRDREFHPRNVLVQPATGRTWKIDAPKQSASRRPVPAAAAADDLGQLDVGLAALGRGDERRTFLDAYLAARGGGAPDERSVAGARRRHEAKESRRLPGHSVAGPAAGSDIDR